MSVHTDVNIVRSKSQAGKRYINRLSIRIDAV